MGFRTEAPSWYIEPSREEMGEMAKKIGMKVYSRTLATDLANLAAGGTIRNYSEWSKAVRSYVETKVSQMIPDGSGEYMLPDGTWTKNKQDVLEAKVEKALKSQQKVVDFLASMEMEKMPGSSPLEKAMSAIKMLSTQGKGSPSSMSGESDIPIYDQELSQSDADQLNETMDSIESMSDSEKELMESDTDDSGKGDGDDGLQKLEIAKDMLKGKQLILDISRNLDKMSKMNVRRSRKVEPDPDGDSVRNRPIKHPGEMHRLVKSEWALPSTYRMYRVITHASQVRERVTTTEKKQLLYIIVDGSGSMKSNKRIYTAGGIVMNRLKAVMDGDAEVYIRFFDNDLKGNEHHANSKEEAVKVMKSVTDGNYSGGSTSISTATRSAIKRIDELMADGLHHKPELVVVTDGDDTIDLKTNDLNGTVLHAFVVQESNTTLTDLAIRTGGVGLNNM